MKKIVGSGHLEPLETVAAYRCPDKNPISRLAFDPAQPTRVALAQSYDDRGAPSVSGFIVDLQSSAVERKLPGSGIGGMRFLRDGRFVYCATEVRYPPEAPDGRDTLVLCVASPKAATDAEIASQGFSHLSDTSLLTFDDEEKFAACGQPFGADVYEIPAPGAAWPKPRQLRIDEDDSPRAYTRTMISPDGSCVAWCDDWNQPVVCFDRATARARWTSTQRSRVKRAIGFSPDAAVVAVIVGRGEEGTLEFYATADGGAVHASLTKVTTGLRCFAFHPGGELVAIGRSDGVVDLRSFPEGDAIATVSVLQDGHVTTLAFDASGEHLLVGGSKGDIALFRYRA